VWTQRTAVFDAEHFERSTRQPMSLAEHLTSVRQTVASACRRVGRDPASVRIVAVTKYASLEAVRELFELGHRELGESRPQQLVARESLFRQFAATWHLIGPLQRNKIRKVLPIAAVIHSIDDVRLLETIDRVASELNLKPQVLLEVNISGETSKQGFSPDELRAAWPEILAFHHLNVRGLMTMAPHRADAENARPVFRGLKSLRDELSRAGSLPLPELSMGMSGDYEVAVEEGATIVRLGNALFEK
jgi:pyridoxal phosphate enzyme (YggS family)